MLTLLLAFVSRKIFLYCLSVDYLGIQGLFSDILNMLSLADLGFGTAMTYSMYKPLAEKDYRKLAGLTSFFKKIYRHIALAIVTIGLALIPFLRYLVKLDTELPYLTVYYLLYLANTIVSYLVIYKTCVITADQKGYVLTKYNSLFGIASTVFCCVFLLITRNYVVYLTMQVAFTYAKNFWCSHVAEKLYPFIREKVELTREETSGIFSNLKSVFLYKVSGVLINATDNTLISMLVGTAMVGYYSNYSMIMTKISGFVNTLFYSCTPSLGNLIVSESKEKRFEIFSVLQSISVLLSSFCVICMAFLVQDFIRIWLGEAFVLDGVFLAALMLNFYLSICLLPIWVYREATGLYRKTRYVMMVTAALNIALSVLLGKWIGLAGIVFATSISKLLTYIWYEPVLLFREYFGESCIIYFASLLRSIFVTIGIAAAVYFSTNWITVVGWSTWFLKSIVTGCVSVILLFVVYHRSSGIQLLAQKAGKMILNLGVRK